MSNPKSFVAVILAAVIAVMIPMSYAQDEGGESSERPDPSNNLVRTQRPLHLLQPLDDETTTLEAKPGIQIFFDYFNLGWPWLLGSAAGFAVLQALAGGVQVILSGGDPGKREAGTTRLLWALAGLLMIAFAGLILRTLNPLFYK